MTLKSSLVRIGFETLAIHTRGEALLLVAEQGMGGHGNDWNVAADKLLSFANGSGGSKTHPFPGIWMSINTSWNPPV